ncbi:MAG: DUF3857 domain-containing protein [Elusimicrobia bacterium]|nr:DUF3857 domain-containing protein [Elusimicrobiota bacterium]
MFGTAILLLFAAQTSASSETLKMRSGTDIHAGVSSLDAGKLLLEDGRSLPREDVLEIQFAMKKPEQAAAAADHAAVQRGKDLFSQAEEFGKRHQGTDGLVLLDEGEYVVRDDGTWVERTRFAGRILKEALKQSWGEAAGYFEEGRERVRIVKATVYHPDGKVFPLEPEKIKTSKPQGQALFFTEYHTISYPLPQVEVGSIVEWEIEKETYNPFRKDFFFPRWGFQSASPVLVSRFSITVPKSQKLFYAVRNFTGPWKKQAEPRIISDEKARAYSWELRDVPQIVGEPLMAQYWDYAPGLKAALFKDWDRIFDWLAQMYKERSNPGTELAQFALELIKDCRTDEEKTAAIYHYIQKQVRYVAVKMGVASGWGGYDANLTWKRRYGCCIDKALLFTAMLKAAGIYSSPVLLDTNHAADHDFRVPDIWFEHAITYLKLAGRGFFLDSTGYDYRYPAFPTMDHGVKALNVFAKDMEMVEAPKPEGNSSRYEYSARLSSAGDADVGYSARYIGAREGELRGYYKSIKESEQKKVFQNRVNEISPSGIRSRTTPSRPRADSSRSASLGSSTPPPTWGSRAGNPRCSGTSATA